MAAGGAVTAVAALAAGQLVDRHEPRPHHRLHDQLGDPVAAAQRERRRRVEVDQVDLDLAAVARVDGARAR